MMHVTGIDLSLTGTGIVHLVITSWEVTAIEKRVLSTPAAKVKGHERIDRILDAVVQASAGSDIAVIEGLSMRSFDAMHANAGLQWIVRQRLHEEHIPYVLIQPASRAQYATGSGKASKEEVTAAVNGEGGWFDFGFTTDDDNIADAAILAAIGARRYGHTIDTVPAHHLLDHVPKGRKPKKPIDWPDLWPAEEA